VTDQGIAVRPDLIADMLAFGAQRSPDRVLFAIEGGVSRTYSEVDGRATRVASSLLGRGLRRGDRIAVWADDSVEYLETYMAAARAGLVMVPVNNRLTPEEARYIVEDADARALMISDRVAERAEATFSAGDFALVGTYGKDAALDATGFEDLVTGDGVDALPSLDEEDLYIIAYTSGTTGFPKGAMLTHRSLKNLARMNTVSYHLPLASVAAYTGSMSFTATVCAFAMSHLFVGGSMHLLGKWDPRRAVDLVVRRGATFIYVPTPGIDDFCAAVRERPEALDTLTTVLHSASKASPQRLARLAEVVGPRLVEGWGATEISGGIVTAFTGRDILGPCEAMDLYDSAGRATVDAVVEIVDGQRRPLPHDGKSEGELAVRSTALMAGYWKQPEATAQSIQNGWYYSGDIGSIDPAGYVYVRERRVDMIVSGGMNVYPAEVEAVIARLPGVSEVAVVGAPHARYGQTVAAAVVLEPGVRLTEADVIEHSRRHLASYKKPTIVRFVDELPKTVSMKLRRQAIRAALFPGDRPS
jgi:fatty-acyl-CoA synthase